MKLGTLVWRNESSMSEVSPTLPVTSLTLKRTSKWQLMTSVARPYDVLYNDGTNVIRRVSVSSTHVPCRRSSQ
ncbi:hypothetical protein DPMN_007050 [Dreissena polymorpha]|uniref:Uncharacterized protein n=1 Tax=Dreissena polymorpha TaxID=45954 RepID=A0A9D4MTK9_DREPO|nr:hypothetical protein DPMN_007050 [Dreissena polymorpha]